MNVFRPISENTLTAKKVNKQNKKKFLNFKLVEDLKHKLVKKCESYIETNISFEQKVVVNFK